MMLFALILVGRNCVDPVDRARSELNTAFKSIEADAQILAQLGPQVRCV